MPASLDGEPGVILHTRPYKENSLLVELYTLNYGRISAVTKLSKKVASRSKGVYQPFILLKLSLRQGRGQLWQLKDAFLQRVAFNFEVPNVFIAQYLNELLYYLIKTQESDPKLFASYIETLEALEHKQDILVALRKFELVLIESLGYALSFADENGHDIEENCLYEYSPTVGFKLTAVETRNAIKGSIIQQIERKEYQSRDVLSTLKSINISIITALLGGRKLKSKELYAQYLAV